MGLIVSEQGKSKMELIPEGVYPARCFSIVDLGTQNKVFKETEKEVHEISLSFEIPELSYEFEDKETGEKKKGCKTISSTFTASLSSKASLRKFLDAWRGKKFTEDELKSFDLKNVVGVKCMLQIVHSEDGKWANIQSAMPLYKGIVVDETDREKIIFEINEGSENLYDENVFEKLPEYLQKKIQDSKEFRVAFGIETLADQEVNMQKEAEARQSPATSQDAAAIFGE